MAVLFTHRIDKIESKLVTNGKEIKVEKTAKFLGVIFDSRLTWIGLDFEFNVAFS